MGRFLAGVASALLLVAAGLFWWRGSGDHPRLPIVSGAASAAEADPLPEPPAASEKTREEKRFSRYDKDKDGAVSREEYLANRRKAFAKLDTNGDGKLSFEEYSVKAIAKFATADADHSNRLTPAEFATTRVVRKSKPRVDCPPPAHEEAGDDHDN